MFLWPNWIRRLTTNQKIGGSSPSRNIFGFVYPLFWIVRGQVRCVATVFADIAQLGERQTEDLKVPGSIPGVGNCFCFLLRRPAPATSYPRRDVEPWHLGRVVKAID